MHSACYQPLRVPVLALRPYCSLRTDSRIPLNLRKLLSPTLRPSRSTATQAEKEPGHQVPSTNVVYEQTVDPEIKAYQDHQRTAARLTFAEEVRTLVSVSKWGVLCSNSKGGLEGFPFGSVVEYAVGDDGKPVFVMSSLSPRTGECRVDSRASLLVMAPEFKGLADARVCVVGHVREAAPDKVDALKALYKQRFPQSFWVDFGDFSVFQMEEVVCARIVGGFGRIGEVSGEEYAAAQPDPVFHFSGPICRHMNDDHADATQAIVQHYVGLRVAEARMVSVDRLGMSVQCSRDGQTFKARVPWIRPVEDRKGIKDVIVEMTRTAAAATREVSTTAVEAM